MKKPMIRWISPQHLCLSALQFHIGRNSIEQSPQTKRAIASRLRRLREDTAASAARKYTENSLEERGLECICKSDTVLGVESPSETQGSSEGGSFGKG